MNENVLGHFSSAIEEYTQGIHYETLLEAKKKYFDLTGQVNEDDDDYEARMNSFNEWYMLQFVSKRGTRTAISDYLVKNQVEDGVSNCFLNCNHSLFEFTGRNLKKHFVLKDILHGAKVPLAKNQPLPGILKNDIFTGRIISVKDEKFLLPGLRVIPKEVKSILAKQSKQIRKLQNPDSEIEFLLQVEYLNTKWKRYGHIDATKIFTFA